MALKKIFLTSFSITLSVLTAEIFIALTAITAEILIALTAITSLDNNLKLG